jgi:hypothetical protein
MDELDDLALQVGEAMGVTLDHSPKSVKKVEKVLGKLHKQYRRTGKDDGMNGVALEFAAYIVKVIESNFEKGDLSRDHPELGKDTFPYRWKGKELFPYAWCQKRIFDGPGDDVWAKFKTLVLADA